MQRTCIGERHMKSRTSMPESDEEIIRKMDEVMKDPKKFEEYVASRLDKAVKNWPRHQTAIESNCAGCS